MCHLVTVLTLLASVFIINTVKALTEEELGSYLSDEYESAASDMCRQANLAEWGYQTDVTNQTKLDILNEVVLQVAAFEKKSWEENFKGAQWENFKNESIKRQVQFLSVLGAAALDNATLAELNDHTTTMSTIYATAKVCPFTNQKCNLPSEALNLDPEITELMMTSRNYDELEYIWLAWHDASGKLMREDYKEYVRLDNEEAKANGFSDMGEMWRFDFESENFEEEVLSLWDEVKPLYDDLHTFVRKRLKNFYGDKLDDSDGLLPAHVFGNMWAQQWGNIFDIIKPFENGSAVDVTDALNEQKYDPKRMFQTSDAFYMSLGLENNNMSYGPDAMLERPIDGREVVCHASAWDFCSKTDFRIKMCTKVNTEDFIVIHHEMGHIQYYLQYKDLPYALRKGANPGFHEAIGDTIALSVATPQHLQKIDLLSNFEDSEENNINALMSMALDKVAFLPFGLLIDLWRWDVFSGKVNDTQWNSHWWELREKYQKVKAPVPRSENDFDPGAKYHVPADSQYISYFISFILQFQMHKALCIEAGQYDPSNSTGQPLHKCDIFESTKAGDKFASGLKLGAAKHWSEALKAITGETNYTGSALLEYFKPLHDYLKAENAAEVSQLVPIIVGSVLGALMVIVLIGYFIFRRRAHAQQSKS